MSKTTQCLFLFFSQQRDEKNKRGLRPESILIGLRCENKGGGGMGWGLSSSFFVSPRKWTGRERQVQTRLYKTRENVMLSQQKEEETALLRVESKGKGGRRAG
mmetsp:Transcript_6059/g.14748  ORF Transcript_6059/g.14748 Transcript_6059/m.14748 type:complete len:103 (+) Transcript_6059:99-407(+)